MTVSIIRLRRKCPRCNAPPRMRTFPDAKTLFRDQDPDRVILTYQCHIRSCGEVYEICAKHFTEAS